MDTLNNENKNLLSSMINTLVLIQFSFFFLMDITFSAKTEALSFPNPMPEKLQHEDGDE